MNGKNIRNIRCRSDSFFSFKLDSRICCIQKPTLLMSHTNAHAKKRNLKAKRRSLFFNRFSLPSKALFSLHNCDLKYAKKKKVYTRTYITLKRDDSISEYIDVYIYTKPIQSYKSILSLFEISSIFLLIKYKSQFQYRQRSVCHRRMKLLTFARTSFHYGEINCSFKLKFSNYVRTFFHFQRKKKKKRK